MSQHNPMHDPEVARKVGLKHRKPVIINGIEYDSALTAAEALGVCDATIRSWCRKGNSPSGFICSFVKNEEAIDEDTKTNCTPVLIDGVLYPSIKEASLALGMNSSTYLAKCLREHKKYKGHICEYANQQPSQ